MSRKPKWFFESREHAPCVLNRWGVVFVPRGHEWARDWWHDDWVPVESSELCRQVIAEAQDAGAKWNYWRGGDSMLEWKPKPQAWECPTCGETTCPGCLPHPSQTLSCFV